MNRRFWIYPTLFVVAMGFAYLSAGLAGRFPHPKFMKEFKKLRLVGVYLGDLPPRLEELIPDGESELANTPNDVQEFFVSGLNMDESFNDSWGNPYQVVSEERDGVRWKGIYSAGLDGESATQGNDADDVNSWNTEGVKFYSEWSKRRQEERHRERMWKGFPMWFIVFLAYFEVRSWLKSKRMPEEDTVTF